MSSWTLRGLVAAFMSWLVYKILTHHKLPEPQPRAVHRIVLVGDSILDNRPYAGTRGSTPQILATLAPNIIVETVARDGDVIAHIDQQMSMLEHDMDALAVVSIGGNDCLGLLNAVDLACVGYDANDQTPYWGCNKLRGLLFPFVWLFHNVPRFLWTYGDRYERALRLVQEKHGEVVALNLYSMNSALGVLLDPAVMLVNWIMARRARKLGIRVIDLHALFTHQDDYALIQHPHYARVIEPSGKGAYKIATAVLQGRIRVPARGLYVPHRESQRLFLTTPLSER